MNHQKSKWIATVGALAELIGAIAFVIALVVIVHFAIKYW